MSAQRHARGTCIQAPWMPGAASSAWGSSRAAVAIYLCVVGIVPIFGSQPLVVDVISLGQLSLVVTFLAAGFAAARRGPSGPGPGVLAGALAGLISGAFLSAFILLGSAVNLRTFLPNASPELFELLTLGSDPVVNGFWIPMLAGVVAGVARRRPGAPAPPCARARHRQSHRPGPLGAVRQPRAAAHAER